MVKQTEDSRVPQALTVSATTNAFYFHSPMQEVLHCARLVDIFVGNDAASLQGVLSDLLLPLYHSYMRTARRIYM